MFYITKYALTKGIIEVSSEDFELTGNGAIYGKRKGDWIASSYRGNDWQVSLEDAREQAEKMRVAKIESLKKSIKKLEKMTFDKVTK